MKKMNLFFTVLIFATVSFAQEIQFNQIQNWTGSGDSVAMLVIDFNDGQINECWAFGYRFDGSKTAADMISEIDSSIEGLLVNSPGGFLNDITYGTQTGIGGSPHYWASFVFQNLSWEMNGDGINEVLTDSMFFGCSYTSWYQGVDSLWYPDFFPENPMPAPSTSELTKFSNAHFIAYPNPVSDIMNIVSDDVIQRVEMIDLMGRPVFTEVYNNEKVSCSFEKISAGIYVVHVVTESGLYTLQIVKD